MPDQQPEGVGQSPVEPQPQQPLQPPYPAPVQPEPQPSPEAERVVITPITPSEPTTPPSSGFNYDFNTAATSAGNTPTQPRKSNAGVILGVLLLLILMLAGAALAFEDQIPFLKDLKLSQYIPFLNRGLNALDPKERLKDALLNFEAIKTFRYKLDLEISSSHDFTKVISGLPARAKKADLLGVSTREKPLNTAPLGQVPIDQVQSLPTSDAFRLDQLGLPEIKKLVLSIAGAVDGRATSPKETSTLRVLTEPASDRSLKLTLETATIDDKLYFRLAEFNFADISPPALLIGQWLTIRQDSLEKLAKIIESQVGDAFKQQAELEATAKTTVAEWGNLFRNKFHTTLKSMDREDSESPNGLASDRFQVAFDPDGTAQFLKDSIHVFFPLLKKLAEIESAPSLPGIVKREDMNEEDLYKNIDEMKGELANLPPIDVWLTSSAPSRLAQAQLKVTDPEAAVTVTLGFWDYDKDLAIAAPENVKDITLEDLMGALMGSAMGGILDLGTDMISPDAAAQARDARRVAEIQQITSALEIFAKDNPKTGYPDPKAQGLYVLFEKGLVQGISGKAATKELVAPAGASYRYRAWYNTTRRVWENYQIGAALDDSYNLIKSDDDCNDGGLNWFGDAIGGSTVCNIPNARCIYDFARMPNDPKYGNLTCVPSDDR